MPMPIGWRMAGGGIVEVKGHLPKALFRKGGALMRQVPRALARARARPEDYAARPPVIVNSLPKSGTHLLMQIALALPDTRYFASFVAQRPSYTNHMRGQAEIDTRLGRIVPGEVVGAHLHYTAQTAATLNSLNALHLFIYRDPRAVVVSEAHYLAHMATWNALHKRFATAGSVPAQIDLAIYGDGSSGLPPAAQRYGGYFGWRNDPDTVAISYESLMNPDQRTEVLQRIAARHSAQTGGRIAEAAVARLAEAIAPETSHTFTGNDPDRWRTKLSEAQKAALAEQFPWLE